jgi:ADYC domain-containing protein
MEWLRHVAVVALCGCMVPDEPAGEPAPPELTTIARGGCDDFGCGTSNSPEIDNIGIHDFFTDGRENAAWFSLESYSKFGTSFYTLDVTGATLTGKDSMGRIVIYSSGPASWPNSLVGSQIILANSKVAKRYMLTIEEVGSTNYWATPNGTTKTTPTYWVRWAVIDKSNHPITEWKNICTNPPADAGSMNVNHLILTEGDAINAPQKTISKIVDPHRVNIGCATHAIAKLHLFGHTQGAQVATAADTDKFVTTYLERQTVLKSLAADYCGDGGPFTMAGTPLNYMDNHGWVAYASPTAKLEARWGWDGAVCLNTPRVLASSTPESKLEFPNLTTEITTACNARGKPYPPPCAGSSTDLAGLHWNTANP